MILKIALVLLAIINGIIDIKQDKPILALSWFIFAVIFSVINVMNIVYKG